MVQSISDLAKLVRFPGEKRDPRGAKPGQRLGGRKKGSINKVKAKRLNVSADSVSSIATKTRGLGIKTVEAEPKKLLLTAMNAAWNGALFAAGEAEVIKGELARLEDASQVSGVPVDAKNELLAKIVVLSKLLQEKQVITASLTREATDLAVKAAPYVHAKLANIESKVSGDLKIVLQKF